jgi:hypothetical protein
VTTTFTAFALPAGAVFATTVYAVNSSPATYVLLPFVGCKVRDVIASTAVALTNILPMPGPALSARPEISSVPDRVTLSGTPCVVAPLATVSSRSKFTFAPTAIVLDADAFVDRYA